MKIKKIALAWIILLLIAAITSSFFESFIQSHHLNLSLKLFHDVFGRNIILLTLNAVYSSIFTLLPFAFFYLFVGMGLALLITLLPKSNLMIVFFDSLIDTLASLPGLLVGLAISALGHGSFGSVFTATVIMVFPHLIRFFESQILHFKAQPFYASAEALGATPYHLSIRHLLPELWSMCIAIFPFILSRLLYIETTLSFLGVGIVAQNETWGQLINQSREYLLEAPWLIVGCGLPLVLTLWSFHLLTHQESS